MTGTHLSAVRILEALGELGSERPLTHGVRRTLGEFHHVGPLT